MTTAKLFMKGRSQAVRLPKELRFEGKEVVVRKKGERVVLEPVKPAKRPERFFEKIRITDPNFKRAPQPKSPPAKKL
jgi:antitoxin VapB